MPIEWVRTAYSDNEMSLLPHSRDLTTRQSVAAVVLRYFQLLRRSSDLFPTFKRNRAETQTTSL